MYIMYPAPMGMYPAPMGSDWCSGRMQAGEPHLEEVPLDGAEGRGVAGLGVLRVLPLRTRAVQRGARMCVRRANIIVDVLRRA